MNRQKRDRKQRAFSKGYQAGLHQLSRDNCPYQNIEQKEHWLGGWREAYGRAAEGYFNR